jgi:hypothetical protein
MGKRIPPNEEPSSPQSFPQVTPRDLYPTSDIRFVMVEVGKLTASVERLIDDVKGHGTKLDDISHKISFLKGAIWVAGVVITVTIAITGWAISAHWDAILAAYRAANIPKP